MVVQVPVFVTATIRIPVQHTALEASRQVVVLAVLMKLAMAPTTVPKVIMIASRGRAAQKKTVPVLVQWV